MSEQIKEPMHLKMELQHPSLKYLDKVCWYRVSWLSFYKSFSFSTSSLETLF